MGYVLDNFLKGPISKLKQLGSFTYYNIISRGGRWFPNDYASVILTQCQNAMCKTDYGGEGVKN